MAKAFLFSDLHCSNKQLQNLYDFVVDNKIESIISAGDIVNMGEPVWFMEQFIKKIDKLQIPFLWVPGNNDFGGAYYKLSARYKSLEGRIVELKSGPQLDTEFSCRFTGVGGSPASWAGQYAGEKMINKRSINNSVFVSHFPPPGVLTWQKKDIPVVNHNSKLKTDPSFPSKRMKDAPLVHICGHLHYRFGCAYLGQTKVIQLASLETGHYAILDMVTLAVEFKNFKQQKIEIG